MSRSHADKLFLIIAVSKYAYENLGPKKRVAHPQNHTAFFTQVRLDMSYCAYVIDIPGGRGSLENFWLPRVT